MENKKVTDVDSRRVEAMRRLPKEVLEKMTREEIKIFLYQDDWPDSLRDKLKDYLVD